MFARCFFFFSSKVITEHTYGSIQLIFIRYGVVGCGQRVARAEPLRTDFAKLNGIKAFQQEHDAVLESLEGSRCESYLIVLGEYSQFSPYHMINT